MLKSIRKRWPDITISWQGVDEFGQSPLTNDESLVGKYQIEDEDEGHFLNVETMLGEWVGEEAVPAINAHYGTSYKTLDECFKNIEKLRHSEVMELCDAADM